MCHFKMSQHFLFIKLVSAVNKQYLNMDKVMSGIIQTYSPFWNKVNRTETGDYYNQTS